ncbi:CMP-N-acetylneuraminate-beta-galactosamide-alpha-2,3-sialyltransferase 1-like isoform X2 [Channa argus]|uniref:CMP-N-acetylneuraminate-beta-galactosamide- alpha-2,3-sialyltransferase 1-like isoform X2 n=2 Tax=Channa argus TaxID=215402 RepID=UPI003520B778
MATLGQVGGAVVHQSRSSLVKCRSVPEQDTELQLSCSRLKPMRKLLVAHAMTKWKKSDTCPCWRCLPENDTWFLQCINQSTEPFLSADYTLSEDIFNWWKLLQEEQRSFITFRETVDRLFQIFPPSPHFTDPSLQQCRTCAVVGNSANLKGSNQGHLIDAHDVIIRMNRGQTKGYETDVGNRTTHRIMYPESAMDLDNTTHLVLFPFKIQDLEWLIEALTTGFSGESYDTIKSSIKANKSLVIVMNPGFMRYVHDTWLEKNGKYPSTGFMAVVLALEVCDVVDVFGYGADKDGNWSHYWEELKVKDLKTGIHSGTEEYNIIQRLADRQKLKMYTRT